MSKTIEMALRGAETFEHDIPEERSALVLEKVRLVRLLDGLLPVEKAARSEVEEQLNKIDSRIRLLDTATALDGLPMLDPEVFSWTKQQQGWRKTFAWQMITVPALAYIDVADESCTLYTQHHGSTKINGFIESRDGRYGKIPTEVGSRYAEIMASLRRRHLSWDGYETIRLTYTYPGIVPDHIKEIIRKETEKKTFSHLAFVCDVDRWQVGTTQAPREFFDPILVGEKGGALWVLASFDPTTVEEYLLREFTS